MWLSYPLLTSVVLAHIGGIPTQADFSAPRGVGALADRQFTLAWKDNDEDPTGKFTFYFAPINVPAGSTVEALPDGTMLPNGVEIPIMDAADQLVWDTSAVPAGSYFVYAITIDPGLPTVFGMSRGTVTIQHPGDPLFPAVVVTEPGAESPPVADRFPIRWTATGTGPLTATVRGKGTNDQGDYVDLATDVPMKAEGDAYSGCFVWDLFDKPEGQYYQVQVEVKDSAGRVHTSYPVNDITIYRDPHVYDAGPVATCDFDAGPSGPDIDAAVTNPGDDPPEESGCGCRAGGAVDRIPWRGLMSLAGLAFLIYRWRKRSRIRKL